MVYSNIPRQFYRPTILPIACTCNSTNAAEYILTPKCILRLVWLVNKTYVDGGHIFVFPDHILLRIDKLMFLEC